MGNLTIGTFIALVGAVLAAAMAVLQSASASQVKRRQA